MSFQHTAKSLQRWLNSLAADAQLDPNEYEEKLRTLFYDLDPSNPCFASVTTFKKWALSEEGTHDLEIMVKQANLATSVSRAIPKEIATAGLESEEQSGQPTKQELLQLYNAERSALIDKMVAGGLSDSETKRLEELQLLVRATVKGLMANPPALAGR